MPSQSGLIAHVVGSGDTSPLGGDNVVRRGRNLEFQRTLWVMAGLFVLQYPMRQAALGHWSTPGLPPLQSARLSLLVDLGFILSYVYVAYRAFGVARAHRVAPRWLWLNKMGLNAVLVGAALDIWEDYRLWHVFPQESSSHRSMVLSFHQAFPRSFVPGLGSWSYSGLMVGLVAGGLLVQIFTVVRRFDEGATRPRKGGEDDASTASARDGDIVICCSGGGIRAAAFSLGGLQALRSHGIYQRSSAVIGVSGGGYVAAAHHVLRWGPTDRAGTPWEEWPRLPDEHPAFGLDSFETRWVRRHTRYVLDSLGTATEAAMSLFFGIAVNLLLVTLFLGGTAWILAWLFLASGRLQPWPTEDPASAISSGMNGAFHGSWAFLGWTWLIPAVGLALYLLGKSVDRFHTLSRRRREGLALVVSRLLWLGGGLTLLVQGVPVVVESINHFTSTSASPYADLLHQLGFVPQKVCTEILKTHDACGVKTKGSGTAAGSPQTAVKAVSLLTVVSSILAVLASAKGSATAAPDGVTVVRRFLSRVWAKIKDPIVPWTAVSVIVLVAITISLVWVSHIVETFDVTANWRVAAIVGVLLIFTKVVTEPNRTSMHAFFRERISKAFLVRRTTNDVEPLEYQRPLRFSDSTPADGGPRLITCAVANVSDEELVPSRRGCTPFVFDDEHTGLTDRSLPGDAALRESRVYEFLADPSYRVATVPAAVAISAAAFSPLAGRENVRLGPYRAVLALGNARLGVWLPNPLWLDEALVVRRLLRRRRYGEAALLWDQLDDHDRAYVGANDKIAGQLELGRAINALDAARLQLRRAHPVDQADLDRVEAELESLRPSRSTVVAAWYEGLRDVFKKPGLMRLVKEAVGKASVYDRFLYVTDGGHYDNLGLVEALRRRPGYIVVLDASNDAEDSFRTLGRAIATARMDLGCEVSLDPRVMRDTSQKEAPVAWCRGTYAYPDGGTGTIFLIKAVMLADVTWDVDAYASENQQFPRTSTANQLYSEFDFEAYRALGYEATSGLFASALYRQDPIPT